MVEPTQATGVSGPGESDTPTPATTPSDGDFVLRAPEDGVPDAGAGVPGPEGDFELRAPLGGANSEGDYELTAPRDSSVEEGDFALARPLPTESPATDTPVDDRSTEPVDAVGQAPAEPATVRPEPAHGSDSTSTPPYGVPGPWAPAPPVQHPATAPAHGAAIPTPPPPPAHATPVTRDTVTSGPPKDHDVPGPHGSPTPTPPQALSPVPRTPWQNYDPWAPVPAPSSKPAQPWTPGTPGVAEPGERSSPALSCSRSSQAVSVGS